jgi:LuxR family maltose regulon positive regulatory protein
MVTSRFVPAHAIDRPDLRRELDVSLVRTLTVLVAGAGAGKSVLLTQWANAHPEVRVVWVDVDGEDADSGIFVQHLLRALEDVAPGISGIASPETLSRVGITDSLADAIVDRLGAAGEFTLILDDIHHLADAGIVLDVAGLLGKLPGNAHVITSSRVDLPLPRSRARLRNEVHEIRQAQLAFTVEQAAELLRRVTTLELDDAGVRALVERTEGWPAGLLLAAVTLRTHPNPSAFIAQFSGSDRLVAEYLSDEVLATLSDDDRNGALELSILDRMSLPLVAEVSSAPALLALLARLQRDSRFVIPLDDHQEWFRFHHLFRDLLRARARAEDAAAENRILTDAADWHLRRGDSATAIEYFLRASEWERAAQVILAHGSSVFERGEMAKLVGWIQRIPPSFRTDSVDLVLLHGILTGMDGNATDSENLLRTAADHPRATPGQSACALSFLADLAQWRPHPQASVDCAERALAALDRLGDGPTPDLLQLTDRHSLAAVALIAGGRAHFLAGNLEQARDWLERGLSGQGARYSVWRISALGSLALAEAWCGETLRALECADEALSTAETTGMYVHPATADAFLARAVIAFDAGDADQSEFELHEARARVEANERLQLLWVVHGLSVRLRFAQSHPHVSAQPPGVPPPVVADLLLAVRARELRLDGAPNAAIRALSERPSHSSSVLFELGAAELSLGHSSEARQIQHSLAEMPDADDPLPRVRRLLLGAWVSTVSGRTAQTDALVYQALSVADRYNLISVVSDSGPEITTRIAALGTPSLPAIAATVLRSAGGRAHAPVRRTLTEPLTEREMEVLVLLPTRFTNRELAARYFVSVNTIKSHMSHIYRKLEVTNRSEAIERANELGLLDEHS